MQILFWLAAAVVAYTYVGFPLLVLARARLRPRPHRLADITPSVSVVIAAHNESAAIGPRVDNLLALDYPADRLEIVIASDGSTDGTVAEARGRNDPRVRVLDLPRTGKAAALNAAVAASSGSILVFSDANTAYAPDAIRALVRSFADPEVGGVAGNQVYLPASADGGPSDPGAATAAGVGERSYWDFDRLVKEAESLGGSVISATGAIYAMRRELFADVPDGVTDDFVTSTRVIAAGRRLVFEPAAVALEPVAGSSGREYRRKVRIMTRGLRGVAVARGLLDPRRHGFYALQLLTHKLLRRLMAVPLLVIAVTSLALWDDGILYRVAAIGQVVVYGLGAVGLALRDRPAGRRPWFAIPAFFCLVNIASLHALVNLSTGRRIDRWQPARRVDAGPPGTDGTAVPLDLEGVSILGTSRTVASAGRTAVRTSDVNAVGLAALVLLGAIAAGIVAADAPILAVAAASALLLGTAIILRPDIATLTTVAILYSNAAVVAVRFHSVPVFVAAFVPMLLMVPLARDLVVRRLPVVAPSMLGWMVGLLFVHLISALFSANQVRSWDAVVVFAIEGFGLYFLLINVIRTPEMLRMTTWVLIGAGALVSVLSVHQVVTSNYDSNYFGFAQATEAAFRTGASTLTGEILQPRLAGSIGETNRFAQVMLMLVPLGIFRFIGEPTPILRLVAGVMTISITLGVVLTFSRGAAVGLGILALALVALRLVKGRHLFAMVLALALVFVAFPQYGTRLESLAAVGSLASDGGGSAVDNSLLSRATETLAAALVIVDHPVIGVGPDMFNIYYEQYAQVVGILIRNDATREAHNLYLGLGAEIGLIGLAVFLIIGFLTARMLLAARRRSIGRRPDLERLATPFLLSLMAYYVTGMFLHLSFGRFYWLMLAVAGAAAVITLREMDKDDADVASRGV